VVVAVVVVVVVVVVAAVAAAAAAVVVVVVVVVVAVVVVEVIVIVVVVAVAVAVAVAVVVVVVVVVVVAVVVTFISVPTYSSFMLLGVTRGFCALQRHPWILMQELKDQVLDSLLVQCPSSWQLGLRLLQLLLQRWQHRRIDVLIRMGLWMTLSL
jgi:hypothetical protein